MTIEEKYLKQMMGQMDDLTRSYIEHQTEGKVKLNVQNMNEGYKKIRAYLLEVNQGPLPPEFPEIGDGTAFQQHHFE